MSYCMKLLHLMLILNVVLMLNAVDSVFHIVAIFFLSENHNSTDDSHSHNMALFYFHRQSRHFTSAVVSSDHWLIGEIENLQDLPF